MNDSDQRDPSPEQDESAEELGLDDFRHPRGDDGLSLDQLSAALSQMADLDEESAASNHAARRADAGEQADAADVDDRSPEVTPLSILEAMLFVGHPGNEPLTADQVAGLMRGVEPSEVHELVKQLNAKYDAQGAPYVIQSVESGYRLTLREQYGGLREKFYGRLREARLSQAAVDVLAIVAYRQPLGRQEVDELRGAPSAAILSQLVRRGLLRVERPDPDKPRRVVYHTTDRFLELFGLPSLAELPQAQDLERVF